MPRDGHRVADGAPTRIAAVIPRYSRPAMTRIWSEEAKLERWLAVELAALDAWAQVGHGAPDEAARRSARARPLRRRSGRRARADDEPRRRRVRGRGRGQLGPAGRWFHYGLTSSDVLDTALALTVQDAGRLVLAGSTARSRRSSSGRRSIATRSTIGRTHGVHAEPMTFGLKLAGWAFQLARDRRRVASALEGMRVGKLSGAVGTYAATPPEVERLACEALGLEPAPSSTQILQRDRHAELLSALALVASSLDRFALEIRHLARTEVREVEEPFVRGQKGSSAMPHKRNPIVAERICGLARLVRGYAQSGSRTSRSGTSATSRTRRRSASSSRRVSRRRLHARPVHVARRGARRPPGADARESRGDRRALLQPAAAAGAGRVGPRPRHRLSAVQRHAMRAWDEGLDFRALVRERRRRSPAASTSTRSSTSGVHASIGCRLPATADARGGRGGIHA